MNAMPSGFHCFIFPCQWIGAAHHGDGYAGALVEGIVGGWLRV